MDSATYLYCVVQAPNAPDVRRVRGGVPGAGRLRVHPAGRSLWIVVAPVPLEIYGEEALANALRDLKWVGRVAVAHEQVVEQFSHQRQSTVVPAKLFTMFSSDERAVEATRGQARRITALASRIAGCEEWGVRITRQSRPVERAPGRGERPQSGSAFLAARKQARDKTREALRTAGESALAAYETLGAIARDVRRRDDVPDGAAAPPLLDAVFLVPALRRTQFKAAAKRLAARGAAAGTQLTLSGPWPAYNFVQPGARQ
ncbi:MAG: hypothetical protein V7647_4084 [Acidobacteriota bacterium]|jgi:hypothetical protein